MVKESGSHLLLMCAYYAIKLVNQKFLILITIRITPSISNLMELLLCDKVIKGCIKSADID